MRRPFRALRFPPAGAFVRALPPASLLLGFLFGSAPAFGESEFEGRVLLSGGEPARGAIVQILGHPGSATTDDQGRFFWSPDPLPPFHVLVVLPGDRYTAPVYINSLEEAAEIRVEPLSVTESVTITSGAVPHTEATPGSAPAVVPGEAIRARQAPRLTDVLEAVPGTGRSSDLHAGVPSIRGLSAGRTLLLLDGARVTTERRAGASATFLDPFFLEAVEVVRGPSPVAYGSDAFGGVVHARTRRPVPGSPMEARARVSLGAGLPETSLGAEVSGSAFRTGFLVQARRRAFPDYSSPDGVVAGSGAEDSGVLLRGVREVAGGQLGVGLQLDAGRNIGRPRRTASVTSYPEEDSSRLVADYQFAPRWGFARMDATAFLGAHRLVTRRESGDGSSASSVAARDFMLRGQAVRPLGEGRLEFGAELLSRFGLEAETSLSDGGDLRSAPFRPARKSAHSGRSVPGLGSGLNGALRREASVFAHGEIPLGPPLQGSAGGRLSAVGSRSGPFAGGSGHRETNHAALSGFVALRADLGEGLALTGQLSRGFRDPTLSDRYYTGLSGRGLVHGNPELRPERALQSDVSFRFGRGRTTAGLHAYRYRIRDLVERYEDGEDLYFFRNRGEAFLRGLELELRLGAPADRYHFDLAAALTRGAAGGGSPLDGVPPANFRAGLRRTLRARSFAEVVLFAFASDSRPGPTERPRDAYARLDAALGFGIASGAEVRLSGRNLLNAAYPISADSRAVLAPGRAVVGTIVWTLGSAP